MPATSTFTHRFVPAAQRGAPALLLLHGTGGDENDLLPLGRMVAPDAALLSVRGKVLEHGMPRFFRRLAEGVFDEADVIRRADELADFIDAARVEYGIGAPIALGYSNGANIAAAMLLLRPQTLQGAALLRAMTPLSNPTKSDLGGRPVLLLSGRQDPIATPANSERLAGLLTASGAKVQRQVIPAGHALSQADVTVTQRWLGDLVATSDAASAAE
jgi:phospholipase/carboxylesterase